MSIIERRCYTRITFECDNCGAQENVVSLEEESPESPHQLPAIRGWMRVPVQSFFTKDTIACSRRCAEALAAKALDDSMPNRWTAVKAFEADRIAL